MGEQFSITAEQVKQLDEEYLIRDILIYLYKAGERVGFDKTIRETIVELKEKTRFRKDAEDFLFNDFALNLCEKKKL